MAKLYGADKVVWLYGVLPHKRISGPSARSVTNAAKASAATSFGPNGSDRRLNLAYPDQPQHLSHEAEMSQLQVFQLWRNVKQSC
jgi:hypothetical protein